MGIVTPSQQADAVLPLIRFVVADAISMRSPQKEKRSLRISATRRMVSEASLAALIVIKCCERAQSLALGAVTYANSSFCFAARYMRVATYVTPSCYTRNSSRANARRMALV